MNYCKVQIRKDYIGYMELTDWENIIDHVEKLREKEEEHLHTLRDKQDSIKEMHSSPVVDNFDNFLTDAIRKSETLLAHFEERKKEYEQYYESLKNEESTNN